MGMKEKGSNDKPIEKDEVTGKDKKSGQLKAVPDPKKTKGLDPKLDEKTKIPGKDLEKPKLKKVKAEAISESPLEKLKRLENAKPIELIHSDDDDEFQSELPDYDLPTKRE